MDIVAPGFGILSTTISGEYGVSSGTSNAAAHVTGAAALLWANQRSLSSNEIIQKLKTTASPLGNANEYGSGLINVAKAMEIITGAIAPLSEENLSGLNTVFPSNTGEDLSIASYDRVNDGATIVAGNSIAVSLKLEGDLNGQNPHSEVIVEVYPATNPSNIVATGIIPNPQLNVPLSYTWLTSSGTPTGTYHIKYRYPALNSSNYDDIFVIYVTQPGPGPDTYESNDTFVTAKSVNAGYSYNSYISSGSDIDYYKLIADKTGELVINLSIPFNVDYDLFLYDASGIQIGGSESGSGIAENINTQVSKDQTYYIKV